MLENLKKLLARSDPSLTTHYVVVGIGAESFAVPTGQIEEIVCLGDLETMPRLPNRFSGPVRIAEKLLSLVRLPGPFTRPPGQFEVTPRTCILVLKHHSVASSKIPKGVVVDRVDWMFDLGEDDVETVTTRGKGLWPEYTLGFAKRHLPVVLIDLQQLLLPASAQNGASPSRTPDTASRLRRQP